MHSQPNVTKTACSTKIARNFAENHRFRNHSRTVSTRSGILYDLLGHPKIVLADRNSIWRNVIFQQKFNHFLMSRKNLERLVNVSIWIDQKIWHHQTEARPFFTSRIILREFCKLSLEIFRLESAKTRNNMLTRFFSFFLHPYYSSRQKGFPSHLRILRKTRKRYL